MVALDEKWYPLIIEAGLFEDYTYLEGEKEYRRQEQDKFLSGTVDNPTLDYPLLKTFDFEGRERKLENLHTQICKDEKNSLVKLAYRKRIREKLNEISLLRAAYNGEDENVTSYSHLIYGDINPEVYQYALWETNTLASNTGNIYGNPVLDASIRLKRLCSDASIDAASFPTPMSVGMPPPVDDTNEPEHDAAEILLRVNEALHQHNLHKAGWRSVIDDRAVSINARQEDRTIRIPRNRKVKETQLQGLIQHEVYYHAGSRERGEQSKLKLLGFGLHHYLRGEEGVAVWAEQQIRGGNSFGEIDRYLAIALALGIDRKPRDFRLIFNILRDFHLVQLTQEENREPDAKMIEETERKAWLRCVRTFRGTTCKKPGQVFMKDKVYVEGNLRVWKVAVEKPHEIRRFPVGKYNPADETHINILDNLYTLEP